MLGSAFGRYGRATVTVLTFIAVMLLAAAGAGVLNHLWDQLVATNGRWNIPPGSAFKLTLGLPFLVATAAAYLISGRKYGALNFFRGRIVSDMVATRSSYSWLLPVAVLFLIPVGAQGAAAILETISFRLYPDYELYESLMGLFSPTGHWLDLLGALITVGLIAPYCEEQVFRGIILKRLLITGANRHVAVIFQGLLFGLVHGNPFQFSYAWPLGILFGYLAIYSRFSFATIYVHAVTNIFAVFALYGLLPFVPEIPEPGEFLPLWFTLGGTTMLVAGAYAYFKVILPDVIPDVIIDSLKKQYSIASDTPPNSGFSTALSTQTVDEPQIHSLTQEPGSRMTDASKDSGARFPQEDNASDVSSGSSEDLR